jgi:hypothetical protein
LIIQGISRVAKEKEAFTMAGKRVPTEDEKIIDHIKQLSNFTKFQLMCSLGVPISRTYKLRMYTGMLLEKTGRWLQNRG